MRSQPPGYGMRVRHAPRSSTNGERGVDRHAHPHVVHRLAGAAHAGQQREVVVLDVDQVRLDVEQSVVAREAFVARRVRSWRRLRGAAGDSGMRTWSGGRRRARGVASARDGRCAAARLQWPRTHDSTARRSSPQPRLNGGRTVADRFVLALDQGTTSSRAIVFDRDGAVRARRAAGVPADLPAARLGRARCRPRSGRSQSARHARRARQGRRRRARPRRDRHHQPARDDAWSGSARPARPSPTRSSGRTGAPRRPATRCATRDTPATFAREDRARARRVLLRHQAQVAARQRSRRARARAARGELAFGTIDSWLVWKLTGGTRARDRRVEREPHAALRHPHAATGTTSCCALLDVPRAVLPRVVAVVGRVRARAHRRRRRADRGHRGRPAGGAVRPGLPRAGAGEEHLRHRLLPAAEHRRATRSPRANNLLTTVAWKRDGVTDYALEGSVFIGGAVVQWLRDGLQDHPHGGEIEALARERRRQRRRVSSCPPSPASARRTGTPTRAARCSGSRAARPAATSRAPRSRRSPTRAPTCSTAMERDAGITLSELRVDGGAAANDLLMQFQADLLGVPVVRPEGARDHGARRRLPRRPRRRLTGRVPTTSKRTGGSTALRAGDVARPGGGLARRMGQGGGAGEGVGRG